MIVPDVITPKMVARLACDIESLVRENRPHGRRRSGYGLRHLMQAVPAVRKLASSARIQELAEPILGLNSFVVRSLFFDKTPEANWKVALHQDLTIAVQKRIDVPGFGPWSVKDGVVHVQPPSSVLERMLTIRLHLDDCGPNSGALQVLPGSHRFGRLAAEEIAAWRERVRPVACLVKAGGALLMRPLLLHASSSARVPTHRRVLHFEFAAEPLSGGLSWAEC